MAKLKHFISRCIDLVRRKGIKGAILRVFGKRTYFDPIKTYGFICDEKKYDFCEEDYNLHKNDDAKILNWIIPEVGVGSGGHLNIFRFISNLENMGFHSRIYIHRPIGIMTDFELKEFILKYFPILDERVECYNNCNKATFAHATIATSWQTAYFLKSFNNTISKFYFVQDYEPFFYAVGSEFFFAENTYKFGFRGITAGDWLKNKLHDEYGMKTDSFRFSYDKDCYVPHEKKDNKNRVFFYSRPVTPRREFELGVLAVNELSNRVDNLEVYLAGWNVNDVQIPFEHKNFGIMQVSELSELYSQCDMCLILSGTNLSLLPLEVMASNSVAVCTKGDNSEWLVNDDNSVMVDNDPISIAEKMAWFFNNPDELEKIRAKGLSFAQSTDWTLEAEKVKNALLKGITEDDKE